MIAQDQGPSTRTGLEQIAEREILQRTWHRIHRLKVERSDGRIIVHGQVSSYYVKQLALAAALEAAGPQDANSIELDIQVGVGHAPPVRSFADA